MSFLKKMFKAPRRHREPVSDPVLGILTPNEGEGWKAAIERDGVWIRFEIGGDEKPTPSLLSHAHDILRDFPSFVKMIKEFLESEAARSREDVQNEIKQLEIDSVCLVWPDRPNDGMIFFTGPNDDERLWRCDYIGREPVGPGCDT